MKTIEKKLTVSGVSETLQQKFERFHAENPSVYNILVSLARRAKANGKRKIGIAMLWEVMRWEIFIETSDTDYKLNNNYKARYARLIMEQEPALAGIFNLRKTKKD